MTPPLTELHPRKILIRSTNWIGDAVMTTPAVRTIRENFPEAEITMLAKPWVAEIFSANPQVDRLILFHKDGIHKGVAGLWRLAGELKEQKFDLAILLQNAFEAALLTRLATIPHRAGYRRDGRSLLLNHPVSIPDQVRTRHQVHYYQELLRSLGLRPGPDELFLRVDREQARWARRFTGRLERGPLVGLNPGAAYGPAKCWPIERYAELARRLHGGRAATLLVFGTEKEAGIANRIKEVAPEHIINLAGQTTLSEAMALIRLCDCFVTNDSGLMHVAAALKTPLVAIFGSTDATATGPFSEQATVIQKELACRPCLKTHCQADFACMREIGVAEVLAAAERYLDLAGAAGYSRREQGEPE